MRLCIDAANCLFIKLVSMSRDLCNGSGVSRVTEREVNDRDAVQRISIYCDKLLVRGVCECCVT